MKKEIVSAVALLCVTLAAAQITITQNDLPQSGYTYLTYTDTTPSIVLGNSSAQAQTWNFSSLSPDYPSMPTYGATSWTPYASSFPASNIYTYGPAALYSSLAGGAPIGSQGMNKGYMFWRTDASGFYTIGFRADSGTYSNTNVQVNPNELLIGTPATYNSVFNNSSSWTYPMNINPADQDTFYTSHTTKTLTADAWGDITTPAGYFPSVLRIHEFLVKTDSVFVRYNNFLIYSAELIRDTTNNYLFMANAVHYPVSIVHADAQNNINSVEYYSAVIASMNNPAASAWGALVFPNPFSDNCRIFIPAGFSSDGQVDFVVFGMKGEMVRRESIQTQESILFSGTGLETGVYLYCITNKKGEVISGTMNIIH